MRKILDKEISLLLKEASLANRCIGEGLTSIRKCGTFDAGGIYMASLLVSSGIERLMKIILVQNFRIENNGDLPNNNYLKGKGHNLIELYQNIINIKERNNINKLGDVLRENEISNQIFIYLNDFAKGARYYNLDELTNSNKKSSNPLSEWENIEKKILMLHKKKKKSKTEILLENDNFVKSLESSVAILKYGVDNQLFRSPVEYLNKYKDIDFTQGYFVYYILKIIKFLNLILKNLENKIGSIPFTNEFFSFYMIVDSEEYPCYKIRKLKKWVRYY